MLPSHILPCSFVLCGRDSILLRSFTLPAMSRLAKDMDAEVVVSTLEFSAKVIELLGDDGEVVRLVRARVFIFGIFYVCWNNKPDK